MSPIVRYQPSRRALLGSLSVGVAALVLTLVLGFFDPRQALYSYLVAFVFWAGIAVAAMGLLMTLHVSHARWSVVVHRALEAMSMTLLPLAALFIPIALGMKSLFVWVAPPEALGEEVLHTLAQRDFYLNVPFFLVRAALYFAVWGYFAFRLWRWSRLQDQTGELETTRRLRRLSAGALPAVGVLMLFAVYDWVMSLTVRFISQILPLYLLGGSLVTALGLLVLWGARSRGEGSLGRLMNADHYHALGMLMLTFVAFWAWMAYSQYMLIWIAHLPEEIPFFVDRYNVGWALLGVFLIVGYFALPFLALLSRDLKRHPLSLSALSAWLFLAHYVDVYWLIMPALHPKAPRPSFADLFALVGMGALLAAWMMWLLRDRPLVPARDPYLEASLAYGKAGHE